MIKRGKRTISGKTRIREWRDCEWRMCTNSWNRERPFGGRSEDKRSIYAMEMASKWECFHFDANARVRRFESEKRYNDRYERLLILWWYARCAETKKSREIKILSRFTTTPYYTIQIIEIARKYERMHYGTNTKKKLQYKNNTIKCTSIKNR